MSRPLALALYISISALGFSATVPQKAPKTAPKLDRPQAGAKTVTGRTTDPAFPIRVKVFDEDGIVVEQRDVLASASDPTIVVGFVKELKPGQVVQAYILNGDREVLPSSPLTVAVSEAARIVPAPRILASAPSQIVPVSTFATPTTAFAPAPAPPMTAPQPQATPPPDSATEPCATANSDDTYGSPTIEGANSGSAEVKGSSTLKTGSVTVCINGAPQSIASTSAPNNFGPSAAFDSGRYDVKFKDAATLKSNQSLAVIVSSSDGRHHYGAQKPIVPGPPKLIPAQVRGNLTPGQTAVVLNATPTIANAGYEVRLYPCVDESPSSVKDGTNLKPFAVTDATGQAALTLDPALNAGQRVVFCQKIVDTTDPTAPPIASQASQPYDVSDQLDLGRVRYYFTSGVVLSNDHGFQVASNGTQAGLFLGLNADRAWRGLDDKGYARWNINTYLDARLTSVATQQTGQQGGQQGGGGGDSNVLQSFEQSQKAAEFQVGTYIPIEVGAAWKRGSDRYSLFIAPLAKAGFVTLTDSQNSSTTVTDRFFKSVSYGTRLGVYQHFRSASSAPSLVSYFDFSIGRFGDFEAFRDLTLERNANAPATPPHEFLRLRPWRYSFEGLLKVPHSPFVAGFNANIGTGALPAFKDSSGLLHPFTQPRDDLRFLIGAQFDFSKLLRALPQF